MMEHLRATKPQAPRAHQKALEHSTDDPTSGQQGPSQQQHQRQQEFQGGLAAADDGDDGDGKPQVSWMALLRNKKKTQMDGIAQIVRINHAAMVIQVGGVSDRGCQLPQKCFGYRRSGSGAPAGQPQPTPVPAG